MASSISQQNLPERLKVLNRETGIIAELLCGGLEDLRKIALNQANYYRGFYSVSTGLERLMKLIIHLERPDTIVPKSKGHHLVHMAKVLEINLDSEPIIGAILSFLDRFATGSRYVLVDYLHSETSEDLTNEPIVDFYQHCLLPILKSHPLKPSPAMKELDDIMLVIATDEQMTEITRFSSLLDHTSAIEHASKYVTMYVGRLLRPFINRLIAQEGNPNPYFSEFFIPLKGSDRDFLNKKKFRHI